MAEAAKKYDESATTTANDKRVIRDWYTTAQAAEYLSTTVPALYMHIQRGNLKPDKPGGRGRFRGHRFARATLDALL